MSYPGVNLKSVNGGEKAMTGSGGIRPGDRRSPALGDVWPVDDARGAEDLSGTDNRWAEIHGEPADHRFVAIGSAGAAPLSESDLRAAHEVVLPEDPLALWRVVDTALAKLAEVPLATASESELASLVEVSERVRRRQDGLSAAAYLECSDRNVFRAAGYLNMRTFLATGHRLGPAETSRRTSLAAALARRTSLTGAMLDPQLPATAEAVGTGEIGAAHALVIAETVKQIPNALGPDTAATVEAELADHARRLSPSDLTKAGRRLIALLDPDGRYTDPADRTRQRGLRLSGQNPQLMSRLIGDLTPRLRAKLDLILNSYAAPGMNNPDDPDSPHPEDGTPADEALAAAQDRDQRSPAQRQHDALEAMCDFVLAHRGLGRPDRIPAELVISISDADLARRAGMAATTTGALVPVADLIELAAQASPHLAVFREHTCEPLYLGRGRRTASKAQRLMLFARDGGCTAPGCDAPFIRTQAHHSPDWAPGTGPTRTPDGGRTDIDRLGAACGGHNRWVGPRVGQWETDILRTGPNAGRMVWRPAGTRGPWQLNPAHRPDLLLDQPAHAPPHHDRTCAGAPPVGNHHRSGLEKALEARAGLTRLLA